MQTSVKHVPWTCRWGRFGGPMDVTSVARNPGFVFWICGHPAADGPRPLDRDSCERCPDWEPAETFRAQAAS
jgi:hypothetical protein